MKKTSFILWIFLSVIHLNSCGSLGDVQPCGQIPDEGCPIGRGGSCLDLECRALYDCSEGRWVIVQTCENNGGTGGASETGNEGGSGGGNSCETVEFDHTNEISCDFQLQLPECKASEAESMCQDQICNSGCEVFLMCTIDVPEGVDVGMCDEEGFVNLQ